MYWSLTLGWKCEKFKDLLPVLLLLSLQVSIFLIFLIFYKSSKFPHTSDGEENVKKTTLDSRKDILQSDIEEDAKVDRILVGNKMTEDDKVLFDPADYDDSGCPKVPFAFAGMTGKTSCIISKKSFGFC